MENKSLCAHPIRSLLAAQFGGWIHQPRTILMFFFMLATTYLTVYSYGRGLRASGYEMHLGESIVWFLMNGFNGMALASLTFLVAVSEIPRQTPFQQYALIRTSREKWCLALLLSCFCIVVGVLLVMTTLAVLFMLPIVSPGFGWSDTDRVANGMLEDSAMIPLWLRSHFSPCQAMLLAICPILLFWTAMVFSVLLFNLLGHHTVGLALNAVILFSGLIFAFENFRFLQSPMTFATLARIVNHYELEFTRRLTLTFIGYALLLTIQVLLIVHVTHRRDVATCSDQHD